MFETRRKLNIYEIWGCIMVVFCGFFWRLVVFFLVGFCGWCGWVFVLEVVCGWWGFCCIVVCGGCCEVCCWGFLIGFFGFVCRWVGGVSLGGVFFGFFEVLLFFGGWCFGAYLGSGSVGFKGVFGVWSCWVFCVLICVGVVF